MHLSSDESSTRLITWEHNGGENQQWEIIQQQPVPQEKTGFW